MCFLPQMSVVFNSLSGAMSCPQLIRLYRNNKTDIRKQITAWGFFSPYNSSKPVSIYPDLVFSSPRLPPFLQYKEDAFVSLHLPGKALCRLPPEHCACYPWHSRAGALLQFLQRGGAPPCVPLPHLQHCHWAQPHLSLNPLPAHSSAIASRSLQSRNNFCCILTNLSLSLVCEQSHSGGWQIDRVRNGKLFFTPLNTSYQMGCESWVFQHSYFALLRTSHTCWDGKSTNVSSKAAPDPVPLSTLSWGRHLLQPAWSYTGEFRWQVFMCLPLSSTSLCKE